MDTTGPNTKPHPQYQATDVTMDTRARNGLETPMQLPYNLCFRFATSVAFYHMFKQ